MPINKSMAIRNYIRDFKYGILPHNPFASPISKALDPGINPMTLSRISRDRNALRNVEGLREAVVYNLFGKLRSGLDRSIAGKFDKRIYIEAMLKAGELLPEDRLLLEGLSETSVAALIEDNRHNEPALFKLATLSSRESINAFWSLCEIKNPFKESINEVIRRSPPKGKRNLISEIPFNAEELEKIAESRNPAVLQEVANNMNAPDMLRMRIFRSYPAIRDAILGGRK